VEEKVRVVSKEEFGLVDHLQHPLEGGVIHLEAAVAQADAGRSIGFGGELDPGHPFAEI
jgi:hypothetical protein